MGVIATMSKVRDLIRQVDLLTDGARVKVRRILLRSMMLTFPVSSYLWVIGVILTGVLYMTPHDWTSPADIPYIPDIVWGVLLATAGLTMLTAMVKEWGRVINILSFLIAMFATTLFIASIMDTRPVATISSGLTAIYYAYLYLCAHLITEWRHIEGDRIDNLQDELSRI